MIQPNIPTVRSIHDDAFVTVPSSSWKELCDVVNSIVKVLNENSEHISRLSTELKNCDDAISKIAAIVEEIYENMS